MDPLAHALFGAALAKSRLGRRSPLSAGALVVGAVAPDLDALAWLVGGADAFLLVRSGLTHSPVGYVLLALALVPFLRWVEREFLGRSSLFSAGGRPRTCAAALLVGLATHVPLDLLTDHGARPWVPFAHGWVRADLLHPADPWLWLLFGGAAALAGRRSAAGSVALTLAALVAWGTIGVHPQSPGWLSWAFPAACLLLAWMRAAGVGRRRPPQVLLGAGGLGLLYLGLLAAARADALTRARQVLPPSATRVSSHPSFGRPLAWTVLALDGGRALRVEARWGDDAQANPISLGDDHPLVRNATRLPESATWRAVARLPAGRVLPAEGGAAWVELRDLAEQDRPWDERLRWRHHFPLAEVQRIESLAAEEERARRR